MKRIAFATVVLLTLPAATCGQPRPTLILPPVSLTTCADEPPAPSLPGREQQVERDRLTLDYILGLRTAYGDCKAKVNGLASWRKEAGR